MHSHLTDQAPRRARRFSTADREMDRLGHFLLGVWREACKHTEIGAALAESAPELFRQFPVDLVLVRRLDASRPSVDTVGSGMGTAADHALPLRTELSAAAYEELLEWCARNEVLLDNTQSIVAPPGLLPEGLFGQVLTGPLVAERGAVGLLLLVSHTNEFEPRHQRVLRLLLEPFTVWLENDRRLRELDSLREAVEADNRSLRKRLGRTDISESIIGEKTGLKEVMARVKEVCRTNAPVLILGETGSGKEVIARSIHERSPRSAGPFLRVNCGAIPPELVDSELFGHERGSFTGATAQRRGWFERADGGTLFLDECGELSLAAQVRLLRILQDGTFERVGGEQQVHVDVRIVAATHRDLATMVAEGSFRQDLWYRISVFPIALPALRERADDVAEMAAYFAAKASERMGFPTLVPSEDDVRLLKAYNWPGNVRELSAVIERAVILGEGKRLQVPRALGLGAAPVMAPPEPPAVQAVAGTEQLASLDAAMARHIEAALAQCHGRIEGLFGAARLLNINPHTLRGRMRSLGIDWRRFRR